MNGVIFFAYPTIAALGALRFAVAARPGAERCEDESLPRTSSGPPAAFALTWLRRCGRTAGEPSDRSQGDRTCASAEICGSARAMVAETQ